MKRKIFIGSSKECIKIAERIKNEINEHCGHWLECEPWNEGFVFETNKGTLECLVKASRKYEYGIFVASNDDMCLKRDIVTNTMRDNVLFEMGLFLGSLGLNRAFLITHTSITLPSDFNGTTIIQYSETDINKAINDIIAKIEESKDSYCLKPVASAALAMGYYDNYVSKIADELFNENPNFVLEICIPENLDNIDNQIRIYSSENPSKRKYYKRPNAYEYYNYPYHYWDIPTTLTTLKNLINYIIPSTEIGVNKEKEDCLKNELRNFSGTLNVLIQKNPICDNRVKIKYI